MKYIAIIVLLLLGTGMAAQDAKVIRLAESDGINVQLKWNALQQAQKDWDDIQLRIKDKYLVVSGGEDAGMLLNGSNFYCVAGSASGLMIPTPCPGEKEDVSAKYLRKGWESGFTFSSDFNYIVPKPATTGNLQYNGFGGCSILTPAHTFLTNEAQQK